MGIKLSQEHVANYFKEQGCELLTIYVNERTKVTYRCRCGNVAEIKFNEFRKGRRCGCGNRLLAASKRNKLEDIKELFRQSGCELLEDDYTDNKQPMEYRCSCGRMSKISYSSFRQGRRCFECGKAKNRKPYTKIKRRYRAMLRIVLESTGQRKNAKTAKMLGYTVVELWNHLTMHPNWNAVKDGEWHIDHIFPIVAFIEHGITDVSVINALSNLQPLEARENIRKRDHYCRELFRSTYDV